MAIALITANAIRIFWTSPRSWSCGKWIFIEKHRT